MSGFIAPRYVGGGTAVGWELLDYLELQQQTKPAANGLATLELPPLDDGARWLVDHAVTSCTSSSVTDLRWYDSTVAQAAVVEQTDNGNFDVSDWANGLRVAPTRQLILQWSGCSTGAVGFLNAQVRVLRKVQR